jgi:diguanylate cyclase (GGDEF)-like protein
MKFGFVSAVVIAALGLVLHGRLTDIVRHRTIGDAERSTALTVDFAAGLQGALLHQAGGSTPVHPAANVFTAAMGVLAQNRQVLGFRAWTPNGVLALSSDGRGIGTDTASNPTLRGVLAGQLSSQIVQPRGPHDGYVTTLLHRHGPLLVVLAPVRLRPGGPVLAIAQVYLPYAPIAAAIRSDTHSMDGLLLAGLGVLYVTLFRLVAAASRRQRQQAECNRWLATHDALTELPNRTLLADRTEQMLAAARRSGHYSALLLLDLNGFKGINDTLGHHHGDLLLKQLGPRLHRVLRDTDTLARLGGDEFVVLAADLATPEAASAITDKLHQALADPFLLDAEPVLVGASIGIAVAPNHGDRFEDLLKHADKAMYAAKGTNAPGHSPPSRAGARVSSHGLKAIEANAAH